MRSLYVTLLTLATTAAASTESHIVRRGNGTSTPTLNDIYNDIQKVLQYLPAALAIIAICGLTVCIIGCVAIAYFFKNRKPRGGVVGTRNNLGPSPLGSVMPLTNRSGGNTDSTAFLTGPESTRGSYAPVSVYNLETGTPTYEQPKFHG